MAQIKNPAPVAEKTPFNVKTVALDSKQSALFLLPDLAEHQSLAVIDTGVLKYLTALLPTANFVEIAINFRSKTKECNNLKDLVACAKDFVVFHESVNLLSHFFDPTTEVVMEEPFNVVKEKTFEETMEAAGYQEMENGDWIHRHSESFVTMMVNHNYDYNGAFWVKDVSFMSDLVAE